MFGGLPLADARLQDLVLARRLVDQIAHPGVPARLDLRGVVLLVLVVDPARAQRQLVLHVLEVAVPEPVGADQAAGFGVAWCRGRVSREWSGVGGRKSEPVVIWGDEPIYSIWRPACLKPIRHRLRKLRPMVDIFAFR